MVLAAFAAIYLIWGSTYLAIKVLVGLLPPLLMAGLRSTIAGALLFSWARVRGAAAPTLREYRDGLVAGLLLFVVGHGSLFWASQHLASGLTAVLFSTIPLWVVTFDSLRPGCPAPGAGTFGGLALGFCGILWLNLPGVGSGIEPWISAVLLLGAAAWALATVWYRGQRRPGSTALSAALPLLGGGLGLLTASTLLGEPARVSPGAMTASAFLSLTYLVFAGSLVAFSAFSWLLGIVPATAVASYAYVNPVVALLLGWLIAGETMAPAALLPVGLILLAVALIVRTDGLRPPSRNHSLEEIT